MDELLNEDIRGQIRNIFTELKEPVAVLFFGQEKDCETCGDAQQLLEEVTALSDKLSLRVYDLEKDSELASLFNVDKSPGTVIAGMDGDQIVDFGVRFSGIPSGHEFSSLIHDLVLVSGRDSGLSQKTRDLLAKLTKPVHLQVFVTPT